MSDKIMTADLMARLQRHYIKPGELVPGGMFIPEVTLSGRRADALYVGFMQSRGKYLVGHEVKASRADWLHELDQPEKAETWFSHCHSWNLVAAHESIVHEGELPPGWGLMVPGKSRTRMTVLVKPELRTDVSPSWEATHAIIQRVDTLRFEAIHADRQKRSRDNETEISRRVEQALSFRDPADSEKRRADTAEALLLEVGDILGMHIRGGHVDWDQAMVRVEDLRESFSAWLRADQATRGNLFEHRIHCVRGLRDSLKDVEKSLLALRSGAAS